MQVLSSALPVAHWRPSVSERGPPIQPKPLLLAGSSKISRLAGGRKAHAPSALALKAAVQDGAATDVTLAEGTVPTDDLYMEQGPTTKVKFVLERKCKFGQRFNVVGNNAMLGNWDVEAGIPMEWAAGDIWSVELDLPIEEQAVEFKFVLTGKNGEVEWQPGQNRTLMITEASSFLVVNEEWEGVESAVAEPESKETDERIASDADGGMWVAEKGRSVDTNAEGVLVPGDIIAADGGQPVSPDADKHVEEEVVKAFGSSQVVDEDPYKSMSETEPELALPELNVAVTAANSVLPSEDAAPKP